MLRFAASELEVEKRRDRRGRTASAERFRLRAVEQVRGCTDVAEGVRDRRDIEDANDERAERCGGCVQNDLRDELGRLRLLKLL